MRRDHVSGAFELFHGVLLLRAGLEAVRYWHLRHIDGACRTKESEKRVEAETIEAALVVSEREACWSSGLMSVAVLSHGGRLTLTNEKLAFRRSATTLGGRIERHDVPRRVGWRMTIN